MIVGKTYPENEEYDVIQYVLSKCELILPSFIRKINDYLFSYSYHVRTVIFSEDCSLELKTIGKFEICNTNIKKFTIPKNVEKIKETPFECVQLESISFKEPSKVRSIES